MHYLCADFSRFFSYVHMREREIKGTKNEKIIHEARYENEKNCNSLSRLVGVGRK